MRRPCNYLEEFVASRPDVKPSTRLVWGHVRRNLTEFFGANRDVNSVTPGDADDFKRSLIASGLAPTTVHKRLHFARTFFRSMVRSKILKENPFADVKASATGVRDRQQFVSREIIERLLDACPNNDWRRIVGLARFGGLRCPCEVLSLRWENIDWEAGRVVVVSPKTEHHAGKELRKIPLFPELRAILQPAFDARPANAEFVIDRKYRKAAMGPGGWANANLRTSLLKIISRAGLSPWPRLFHNLRASRQTELVESYPAQVVTSWMGNTPNIAMKHYLMTTEQHIEDAAKGKTSGKKAVQNPVQQCTARA